MKNKRKLTAIHRLDVIQFKKIFVGETGMELYHFTIGLCFRFDTEEMHEKECIALVLNNLHDTHLVGTTLFSHHVCAEENLTSDFIVAISNCNLKQGHAIFRSIRNCMEINMHLDYSRPYLLLNTLKSLNSFEYLGTVNETGKVMEGDVTDFGRLQFDLFDSKATKKSKNVVFAAFSDGTESKGRQMISKCAEEYLLSDKKGQFIPVLFGNSILENNIQLFTEGRYAYFDDDGDRIKYFVLPDRTVIIDNPSVKTMQKILSKCVEIGYRKFVVDAHSPDISADSLQSIVPSEDTSIQILTDMNRSRYYLDIINFSGLIRKADIMYMIGNDASIGRYIDISSVQNMVRPDTSVHVCRS